MAALQINTYHCLCTSLLLATTHTLSSLPRRSSPSIDSAIIVPLPPMPQQPSQQDRASPSPSPPSEDEDEDEGGEADQPKQPESTMGELGYTILLSTTLDRRPTLIRRSDGFERRYLVRCGRCRLVVGYELDRDHYSVSPGIGAGATNHSEATSAMDVDGDGMEKERMKIVYLLPGGIMSTDVMASGKKVGEKEVVLGDGGQVMTSIAAWE